MANIDQELLSVLRDIKASLNSGKYNRDSKHARKDNSGYKSEDLAEQASKLSQAFEDQHISLGKFSKSVLFEVIPSLKVMNQGFTGARNSLKEYTKYSDTTFKNISSASFEIFAKITGNSKRFQKEFDDIISAQIAAKKSLENAIKDLDNKKSSKANINDAKIAVEALSKSKFGDAFIKSIDKNTLKALESGKVTKAQLSELNEHISRAMSGTMAGGRFAMMGSNSVKGLAAKSLVTFLTEILPKMASQGIKDYRANRYYGVGGTTYGANIEHLLGMSEEERSQLVGKNKQTFSLLGNGNLNASFENGTFSKLQDNMLTEFGFTGKQAAEEIVKNMNAVFNSGFAVTGNNLEKFNKSLNEASRLAKMTPDEFRDIFSQMGSTGQIAQFRQATPGRSEEDQMKALMQNTAILIKVNQNLGLNNEEIKKQNQAAYNATHAGFLKTIMNQVGAGITAQELKTQNNDARSVEDIQESLNFSRLDPAEQARLLGTGKYTQAFATQAAQDRLNARALPEEQRRTGYTDALKNGSTLANALIGGSSKQFWAELVRGTFGSDIAGESAEDSMQAIGQKTRGKSNNTDTKVIDPTTDSLNAMRVAIGNEQSGLIESLMKAKNALDTIFGNPLTAGAAGVAEGVGLGVLLGKSGKLLRGAAGSIGRLFGIGGAGGAGAVTEGAAVTGAEAVTGGAATGLGLAGSATIGGAALALGGGYVAGKKHLDNLAQENNLTDGEKAALALAGPENMDMALAFRDMYKSKHADFSDVKSSIGGFGNITPPTPTTDNLGLPKSANTQQKANYIGNRLMAELGISANGAAGVIGNGMWESGGKLNPNAVGDNGTSLGAFQWHNDRMQQLLSSVANPYSLEGQTDFLEKELKEKFPGLLKMLQDPNVSKEAATAAFQNIFENPLDKIGSLPNRIDAANIFQPSGASIINRDKHAEETTNNQTDLVNSIIDALSMLGIKLDKIHDVNTEHLDVTKRDVNQNSDQALVNQRIANMQKLSQNAAQSVFNTLASHNVPPS